MTKFNVLIPAISWPRIAPRFREFSDATPVLLDREGTLIDLHDNKWEGPLHGAWHNFEISRPALKPFLQSIKIAESLQFMQTAASGLDAPFFADILRRGIILCNSDAQSLSIAEYVVASLLNVLHNFPARKSSQLAKTWQRHPFREVAGLNIVVVGYGNIGSRIVHRLRGFEADITVVRRETEPLNDTVRMATLAELPDLLPRTDVIILACALNDQTRHLLDATKLQSCKDETIIINVARGALIDESALLTALDRNVGHAVLDVFETEPLPQEHPFWSHPNVSVTAHSSNAGSGRERRGDDLFLENLQAYLQNKPLRNLVDVQTLA